MAVFFNFIVFIFNIICFFSTRIKPSFHWIFGFSAILIPFAMLFSIFGMILLIRHSKTKFIILPLFNLTIGLHFFNYVYKFTPNIAVENKTEQKRIKILSYNVRAFNVYEDDGEGKNTVSEILDFIKRENADIVCLQEFYDKPISYQYNTFSKIAKWYPYNMVSQNYTNKRGENFGLAIFSKTPFIAKEQWKFSDQTNNHAIKATILWNNEKIDILNVHLQSMKIRQKHLDLESLLDFKNIISSLKKYKNGLLEREKQVDYLHSKQKETSNKSIICIDLNDTPFSYAYHSMKSRYQDAYMQQGRFLGKTYNSGIPFLRIDYQFADPRLKVLQFEIMNDITLSDHYPIVVHYGL